MVLHWALLLGDRVALGQTKPMKGNKDTHPCALGPHRLQHKLPVSLCPLNIPDNLYTEFTQSPHAQCQPHEHPVCILLSRDNLRLILFTRVSWKISKPRNYFCGIITKNLHSKVNTETPLFPFITHRCSQCSGICRGFYSIPKST